MLLVADALFWIFHTLLILFNVFGWMFRVTRRWNLITLALTAASWFVMGLWHGIGYCLCTDWHYQIREAMGIDDPDGSYLQLMAWKISGWFPPQDFTNRIAAWVFGIAVAGSLATNLRDAWRKRYARNDVPRDVP